MYVGGEVFNFNKRKLVHRVAVVIVQLETTL